MYGSLASKRKVAYDFRIVGSAELTVRLSRHYRRLYCLVRLLGLVKLCQHNDRRAKGGAKTRVV